MEGEVLLLWQLVKVGVGAWGQAAAWRLRFRGGTCIRRLGQGGLAALGSSSTTPRTLRYPPAPYRSNTVWQFLERVS